MRTHVHGPIGSDHMLQSRGSEVAHAQAEKIISIGFDCADGGLD